MQLLKIGPFAGPCGKGNEILDPKTRRGRFIVSLREYRHAGVAAGLQKYRHTVNIQQGAIVGVALDTNEGSCRKPQLAVFIK